MKKIKFIIVLLAGLFMIPSFAQTQSTNDEVTLVVSADGATKEEATKVALRSAIEQAYGTFVSANTTILNDELVKDEIVTVSQGNIKEYKEIANERTPDGMTFVTLQATVCISKLVSYAKSKGASTEFAGATFGMNMKIEELNKKNEKIAIDNLAEQVKKIISNAFDFELEIEGPRVMENDVKFDYRDYNNSVDRNLERMGIHNKSHKDYYLSYFNIKAIPNENLQKVYNLIAKTFNSVLLTKDDVKRLYQSGISTHLCNVYTSCGSTTVSDRITTRNTYEVHTSVLGDFIPWATKINLAIAESLCNFEIIDNMGNTSTIEDWGLDVFHGAYQACWLPCAQHGTNLFRLWTNSVCRDGEDGGIHGEPNFGFTFWFDNGVYLITEPVVFREIPIIIPKEDISKYSNFEIRKREVPIAIDVKNLWDYIDGVIKGEYE